MDKGFNAATWNQLAAFTGRCATPEDVDAGRAVFALGDTFNGRPIEADWPQCGIWFDDDEDDEFAVVIVQAESHDTAEGETMEVLGLVLPDGRTAVALAEDVDEVDPTDPFWTALIGGDDEEGD